MGAGIGFADSSFVLSPDGRHLVFQSARGEVSPQIYDLSAGSTTKLNGFVGDHFFWSPDGKELGYVSAGRLWRKGFPTGQAREICEAPNLSSAHWGANGIILFASSSTAPISRVPADGGNPVQITSFGPGSKRHEAPFLLPDSRHFVYWSAPNRFNGSLILADLEGKDPAVELAQTSSSAIYLPRPGSSDGALVYRASDALMLLPFDSSQNQVTGKARTITERADRGRHFFVPATASAQGDLIYRDRDDNRTQVKIFNRQGTLLSKRGELKEYLQAKPSPDFRHLAIQTHNPATGQSDFEFLDMDSQRVTPVPAALASSDPVWAPDGQSVLAGNSSVSGGADLYRIFLPTSGQPRVTYVPWQGAASWPSDWFAKSNTALLIVSSPKSNFDIWTLPMDGTSKPRPLIATPAREQRASLSPDGKLLVYMSNESGSNEVWVTPNPPDGRKWKISTGGGVQPNWRGDGKEIFYRSEDLALMSVTVAGTPAQPSFAKPSVLFGGRNSDPALAVLHAEPSSDGQRFAVITGLLQQTPNPLRLRLNWWTEGR